MKRRQKTRRFAMIDAKKGEKEVLYATLGNG